MMLTLTNLKVGFAPAPHDTDFHLSYKAKFLSSFAFTKIVNKKTCKLTIDSIGEFYVAKV
jgi:hypothetical protein